MAILVRISASNAFVVDFIVFRPEGRTLKKQLSVFIDKEQPGVRCLCYRFTVAVDDTILAPGRTSTTQVAIVRKVKGETQEIRTINLEEHYDASPVPPLFTPGQEIFLGVNEHTEFDFVTLAKACMNPSEPKCDNLVSRHVGTFSGKDLIKLAPITIQQLSRPE